MTAAGRYRNPILPGCHPDPSICRVGDEYYLVTSTFEYLPGLPLHRSTNLVDWEPIGHAIERPGQLDLAGLPGSKGLYAPTIRHHDGRFFVVCTVVQAGGWKGRVGHLLVTADDPAGPWSDPVWFDGIPGIDPSLTFDGDRVWMCATRQAEPQRWHGHGEIWLRELDPATWRFVGDEHVIWHGAVERAGWAEGPHIFPRPGGGWVLVAAEGGTDRDHAVCVAYADDLTGPYIGDEGNPRLTHRDLGDRAPIANVGHADLVEAADGRWWATVLATHTIGEGNGLLGRQTHLVPVEWERGRPLFAPGDGRVRSAVTAEGVPDQAVWPTSTRDDFDDGAIDHAWNGVTRFPSEFADAAARPGWVRLVAGGEPGDLGPRSLLLRRLPAARVEAWMRFELGTAQTAGERDAEGPAAAVHTPSPLRGGAVHTQSPLRGGLMLRTSETAYVEASVDSSGRARAVLCTPDDGAVEVGSGWVDPAEPIEVRLLVDGLRGVVRIGGERIAEVPLTGLATGRPSMFVGSWIGALAVGSGHVDVDAFGLDEAAVFL